MKIVYTSNAGHTKKYAEILSETLNIECISLKKYQKTSDKIIYMGWIFGNGLCGYKKIPKEEIICTVAVGMNFESKKNSEIIIKTNAITEKFFYLQGGLEPKKLKGIKKIMIKIVAGSITKTNKPEDKELIEIFKNGNNCVKKENLSEIIKYINQLKEK